MKYLFIFLYAFISVGVCVYLLLPNPQYPDPLADSLQSVEPADQEDPSRRAYFTNFTREEVISYYKDSFNKPTFGNFKFPSLRLNYPPEEAQTLIRDQTRSTFLEEIVHPFRESLFINGFEPGDAKDAINVGGQKFRQKIIVKYVSGPSLPRVLVIVASVFLFFVIVREWAVQLKNFFKGK